MIASDEITTMNRRRHGRYKMKTKKQTKLKRKTVDNFGQAADRSCRRGGGSSSPWTRRTSNFLVSVRKFGRHRERTRRRWSTRTYRRRAAAIARAPYSKRSPLSLGSPRSYRPHWNNTQHTTCLLRCAKTIVFYTVFAVRARNARGRRRRSKNYHRSTGIWTVKKRSEKYLVIFVSTCSCYFFFVT